MAFFSFQNIYGWGGKKQRCLILKHSSVAAHAPRVELMLLFNWVLGFFSALLYIYYEPDALDF